MHRIKRPDEPSAFLRYRTQNPNVRDWSEFNSTRAYHEARMILFRNQNGLCAYCESSIPSKDVDGEKCPRTGCARIEHFHAKADPSPSHNWMLDWKNLMMVCMAEGRGTERHCDARKEDVQTGNYPVDGVPQGYEFDGYILNPYEMPNECLFCYREASGELHPDESVCRRVAVNGNRQQTTEILVDCTIKVLGLNSSLLCNRRKVVQREYENRRKALKDKADKMKTSLSELVAEEWFGDNRIPSFFTTRRCLLKGKAEKYIVAID